MDHHSFAFQLLLFLMFYGTFEWVRYEQSVYQTKLKAQQEQASSLVSEAQHVESVNQSEVGINVMGNTEVANQVVESTEASVIETAVEFEPIVVEIADVEPERAIIAPVAIAELSVESESKEPVAIAELKLSEPITAITVDAPLETTVEPEPIVIAAPKVVEPVTLTTLESHAPVAIAEEPIPTEPILSELTSNQLTPLLALIERPNTASGSFATDDALAEK